MGDGGDIWATVAVVAFVAVAAVVVVAFVAAAVVVVASLLK